jgi:CBS domain containing-hemolysin-like protein
VTLDDLISQIVGEVHDPFDKSAPEIQRLPDGSALVDGLTPIETVNEALGLSLREEFYDTIAGFVLGKLGRIAKVGDVVEADGVRLKVEALDGLRIARLSLFLHKPQPAEDAPAPTA